MSGAGFDRLPGVLISPVKTFRSIGERPTWWPPLVVLVVLVGLIGVLVVQRMDFEAVMHQQMAKQNREMSQEQMDRGVQLAKRFAPVFAVGSALVVWPVALLLIALVLWVLFKLFGSELSYLASFAVTLHSMMPVVAAQLLALPIILSRKTISLEDAKSGGILMSNLGVLAPEGSSAALHALLASFDFFGLWTLLLLILGYREVAKVSTAKAATTVVVLWLLVVGLRVGWAAVFG